MPEHSSSPHSACPRSAGRDTHSIHAAHCNGGWPASLQDYDSLDEAADHVPADIIALAAAELGEERALWRDI